jgi:anti-sigma-K factor RskA
MTDPTTPDEFGPEEQDELLAAEYVLGILSAEERRRARERAEVDSAFAERIVAWEIRLSTLNDGYEEIPPADLLPRIEDRLFATPPTTAPAQQQGWFSWGLRGGAMVTALIAAIVIGVLTLAPPTTAPAVLQAELVAEETDLRFAARWDASAGLLEVTRADGAAAPTGQDYELWVIDDSGVPRSLGLLRDTVTQVQTVLTSGLTLAISLEPEGGSPDAAPSGPVLAAAPLDDA